MKPCSAFPIIVGGTAAIPTQFPEVVVVQSGNFKYEAADEAIFAALYLKRLSLLEYEPKTPSQEESVNQQYQEKAAIGDD